MDTPSHVKTVSQGDERTRPRIHFTDSCWINDPCAPSFDSKKGLYHLFYQCNPFGCDWGNMSWGHVVSDDLTTWTKVTAQPALQPDELYDKCGVFTGCAVQGVDCDSNDLVVCYSSIRRLPFHWSTPPYPHNAAGISLASSSDGGKSWTKCHKNPIVLGEPFGTMVTGFRDPYVAMWPALDRLRDDAAENMYALVSGGIEGRGPTSFLYAVTRSDPTLWKYLGPLVNLPPRFSPSASSKANFGLNWECTNFVTLCNGTDSKKVVRHFLVIGAEGDLEREHLKTSQHLQRLAARTVRQQLWMCGTLTKKFHNIELEYEYGGLLDHGSFYAANTFDDPSLGKRIVHGWIPEEDCTPEFAEEKGWNGTLALPREIFLLSIENVSTALQSPIPDITYLEAFRKDDGFWNLLTLGIRPVEQLAALRTHADFNPRLHDVLLKASQGPKHRASVTTAHWELEALIQLSDSCQTFSLEFRHNDQPDASAKFEFSLAEETISIHRQHSKIGGPFNGCMEQGPFTLFKKREPGVEHLVLERLHLRLYMDGDVLEVFVNDRFALATMVYRDLKAGDMGIVSCISGKDESAVIIEMNIWDGLRTSQSRSHVGTAGIK